MRSRKGDHTPIGFGVDCCNDLAEGSGVTAEIVEMPLPECTTTLMSGRVDVGVDSTSDTLGRAKTVGLSNPYVVSKMAVLSNDKSGITSFAKRKLKVIGATAGIYKAVALKVQVKESGKGEARSYLTYADVFLVPTQGQIIAILSTLTLAQAKT